MDNYQSITKILGVPDAFGVVLLMFTFILLLAPYFSGADFGAFKIPLFTDKARKWLKIIGPPVFIAVLVIFIPFIPQKPNPQNHEKQHIELTIGLSSKAQQPIADALREFERIINTFNPIQNATLSLNIIQLPYDKARQEFLKEGTFDIIMVDDPWIPEYWENLHPLDEEPALADYLKERKLKQTEIFGKLFLESLTQACVYREKLLALPIMGNVQLAIHRVDTRALIENDLEENERRTINAALDLSGFPTYYNAATSKAKIPMGVRYDVDNDIVEVFWELLRAFGYEERFDQDVLVIDKVKAEAARDWLHKYSVNLSYKEIQQRLLDGNPTILMGVGWPSWIATEMHSAQPSVLENIRLHRIARNPVMGAWLLALPKKPLRPDLRNHALRILLAMTADSHFQFFLAQKGITPVLNDFSMTEQLRAVPFWRNNYFQIQDALRASRPRPRTRHWKRIENELGSQYREGEFRDVPGLLIFR